MAFRRNADRRYPPPWVTSMDDGYEDAETSSFVIKQPSETSAKDFEESTTIPIETLTPIFSYPPETSYWPPDKPYYGDPSWTYTERPSWVMDASDSRGPPLTATTLSTKTTAHWGLNGIQSSPLSTTPTLQPTENPPLPAPTHDGPPGLQNNGASGPNRTPTYAAAGVIPVVIIIIGFIIFTCLRRRRQQQKATVSHIHTEEMKKQPKPVALPYIPPPSPPPVILPQYSWSSPLSYPPTASLSQPVILGPIPSSNNGAYLTGMDTSDVVSMTSASNISRMGTVVDRDPFADGRSLEEAPPPYRPSSLPPASLASASRNSSVRTAAPAQTTSRTHLIERSPFDDSEDDSISELSSPTLGVDTDAMSAVSELSYQVDPVIGRSPF